MAIWTMGALSGTGAIVAGVIVALTLLVSYGALAFWTTGRLRELRRLEDRVGRLADGVALLTDTTEAGLATVIREVEALGRRPGSARPASRRAVEKRIVAASRDGQPAGAIAAAERLSESEIRLHLSMAEAHAARRRSAVQA